MIHRLLLLSTFCLALGLPVAGSDAQETSGLDAAAAVERALVDVIGRAEKSVVAIYRIRKELPEETFGLELRPDPFGRRATAAPAPQLTDPDFVPTEYGTGVVIDPRGLILTAYHVLGEQSEYYVCGHDRKFYRAWIKGADPRSDLAVLAVQAIDLTPIAFGDAAGLKKGQIVIALGNPYAIARDGQVSASWGIVSNLGRKAPSVPSEFDSTGKSTLHHFGTLIQTDAKLNLGTSGGPLLNLRGEMVGLTVALAATAGYESAAGYAIPVDATFRRIITDLKDGREVEYGFLGIQPANLTAEEMAAGRQGVRVDWIVPGTPAEQEGLRPDDIVTAVDDRLIYEADSLVLEVGKLPVESVARLNVIRDGRPRTVQVTLAKYPVRGRKIVTTRPAPWRGMRVDYPTAVVDEEARARGAMAFSDNGVIVIDVEEGTPAWDAGLRPGMRISHVGRTAVRTPGQFRAALAGREGPIQFRLADDETPLRTVGPIP
ncbi:MAG: trypsin-like peptidase domain-containing protein [Pirellulales bacterium]|nr:trypsin-like peptidase domain-containing protein [Pirellulales bacterium]